MTIESEKVMKKFKNCKYNIDNAFCKHYGELLSGYAIMAFCKNCEKHKPK